MSSRRQTAAGTDEMVPRPRITPVRLLLPTALVLAFLTHLAALWFPFVDDDEPQIVMNAHVQAWHFLSRYFTADVWSQMGCGSNYYRPIFLLWLRLNHSAFGLNPMGWHVAALLLHVLATWLVYLLASRVLNDKIAAGLAATLFAVHPITVESTAWVSGATEALEGVLFLGCILCYLRGSSRLSAVGSRPEKATGSRRPSVVGRRPDEGGLRAWRIGALGLFVLALLAKETAIVIPLLVLIYEARFQGFKVSKFQSPRVPHTASVRRETGDGGRGTATLGTVLRVLAPYLAVLAVYLAVRALVLRGMAPGHKYVSTATALATWPAVLWFYLHKLVAPWPLSLNYSLAFTTKVGLRNFWLPIGGLLAVGAGLWTWNRRDRRVALACAWLLIPLLPAVAATLRFDRGQLVHDRYLYLSLVGFSMLGAIAIRSLAGSPRPSALGLRPESAHDQRLPLMQIGALLVLLCVFGITTAKYIGYWSSNMALYRRAVAVAPNNAYAHNSLAEQLFNHMQFKDALSQFQQALAADPQNTFARTSLAQSYGYFGQWQEAVVHLRYAAQVAPTACAYSSLADAQTQAGQWAPAEESLRHALALPPCPPSVHWALAELLRHQGRTAEARKEYEAELAEHPTPQVRQQLEELDRPANH